MRTDGSRSTAPLGSSVTRSPSLDQYSRCLRPSKAMPSGSGGTTGGRTSTSSGRNGLPPASSQGWVDTNSTPSMLLSDRSIRAV